MKRTKIGLLSAIIILIEALIIGVLTMLRTKIILDYYGTNINGVIQLATQLTAYMLLFESGMTAAYQYNLYKPVIQCDKIKISQLYGGMSKDFFKISLKMSACVVFVSVFYSFILKNRGVSYFEAVSLLSVMGIRIVAPYFFTVPLRTLIIVKERKYVTDIVETIKNIFVLIIEILLIIYSSFSLFIILSIQIIICFFTRYVYVLIVRKYFGEVMNYEKIDRTPSKMTKDILIHRISGMINSNTDSVLLSFFKEMGLNSVTIYSSFSTLINYPIILVIRLIDGLRASIAIKILENPRESYFYFREIYSFSKICALTVLPVFISQANSFVSLWIGRQYTIKFIDLILFSIAALHQIMIPSIYATRDALGLYKESKKFSILQAVTNFIFSLILIKPFGITGILFGTVISDWLILEPMNIKLIFRLIFKKKFDMYSDYLFFIITFIISIIICIICREHILFDLSHWGGFFLNSTFVFVLNACFVTLIMWANDSYFRHLIRRFIKIGGYIKNDNKNN